MENTELKQDQILEKKMDDYSTTLRDFKSEGELLVTITLNEYRFLVDDRATNRNYSSECYDLRKQVENLQKEISDRDKRIVALTEQLKGAARLVKAFKMMGKEDEK
jgi:hypothetical protein